MERTNMARPIKYIVLNKKTNSYINNKNIAIKPDGSLILLGKIGNKVLKGSDYVIEPYTGFKDKINNGIFTDDIIVTPSQPFHRGEYCKVGIIDHEFVGSYKNSDYASLYEIMLHTDVMVMGGIWKSKLLEGNK